MGDILTIFNRLDVSPLIAILLVALSALLRTVSKGIMRRLDLMEGRIAELETCKHRHTTSLAVIKARLDIVEDNADNVS